MMTTSALRTLLFAGFSSLCLLAAPLAPASAGEDMDLVTIKNSRLAGEQMDGLIGIVTPPGDKELQEFVAYINNGRSNYYRDLASSTGNSMSSVKAEYGRTLIQTTPPGQYFRNRAGKWEIRK